MGHFLFILLLSDLFVFDLIEELIEAWSEFLR